MHKKLVRNPKKTLTTKIYNRIILIILTYQKSLAAAHLTRFRPRDTFTKNTPIPSRLRDDFLTRLLHGWLVDTARSITSPVAESN